MEINIFFKKVIVLYLLLFLICYNIYSKSKLDTLVRICNAVACNNDFKNVLPSNFTKDTMLYFIFPDDGFDEYFDERKYNKDDCSNIIVCHQKVAFFL